MYRELLADLPKKGTKACHNETGACGRVIKLNPLKGTVDVAYDDGGYEELPPEKLERPQKDQRQTP
jgi:cell fate regulator YaaT (PSP1 superfamily)